MFNLTTSRSLSFDTEAGSGHIDRFNEWRNGGNEEEKKQDEEDPDYIPDSVEYQSKIWPEYLQGADKEDKAMVYDLKTEMDTVLIFAGLFTAALAPFIMETYKLLKRDPDDTAMTLLAQISEQLKDFKADFVNSTTPTPTSLPSLLTVADINSTYQPPPSAIACNILLFTALGLSLVAALMAVMIQRWARRYIRSIETGLVPFERARVREFLYCGLYKFKIQYLHEVVPILLEFSVFAFYAGLVLFLWPINWIMGFHTIGIVMMAFVTYLMFTTLPIIYSDCPFGTPLTRHLWSFLRFIYLRYRWARIFLRRFKLNLDSGSLARRQQFDATEVGPERAKRDQHLLVRTIDHLYRGNQLLDWLMRFIPSIQSMYRHDGHAPRVLSTDGKILLRVLDDNQARLGQKLKFILKQSVTSYLPGESVMQVMRTLDVVRALAWLKEEGTTRPKVAFGVDMVDQISRISMSSRKLEKEELMKVNSTGVQVFYTILEDIIHFHRDLLERLLELDTASKTSNPETAVSNLAQTIVDDKAFWRRQEAINSELKKGLKLAEKWESKGPSPSHACSWPWITIKNQIRTFTPLCEVFIRDAHRFIAAAARGLPPDPEGPEGINLLRAAIDKGDEALEALFNARIYVLLNWRGASTESAARFAGVIPWIPYVITPQSEDFRKDLVSEEAQKEVLDAMITSCARRARTLASEETALDLASLFQVAERLSRLVVTDVGLVDKALERANRQAKGPGKEVIKSLRQLKKQLDPDAAEEQIFESEDEDEKEPDRAPPPPRPPRQVKVPTRRF